VLADTTLAGLKGKDAAQSLRSRISRDPEDTRIVAITIEHSPQFREEKTAQGFDGTLSKPFRKDELLALLATLLREPASS